MPRKPNKHREVVYSLLRQGFTGKQISEQIGLSVKMVNRYRRGAERSGATAAEGEYGDTTRILLRMDRSSKQDQEISGKARIPDAKGGGMIEVICGGREATKEELKEWEKVEEKFKAQERPDWKQASEEIAGQMNIFDFPEVMP